MHDLTTSNPVYDFHGHNVRIIMRDGEPWFVAKDVCDILGYARPADAVSAHCREAGTAKYSIRSGSQNRNVSIINEGNLYRLVMRSKLPAAEAFEDWVVSDVLPSIRKTGGYGSVEEIRKQIIWDMERKATKREWHGMTEALKDNRIRNGKDVKEYHFINEANMLNRIIIGGTSAEFKEMLKLEDDAIIRDKMEASHLMAYSYLQNADAVLLELNMPFNERKKNLEIVHKSKFGKVPCLIRTKDQLES